MTEKVKKGKIIKLVGVRLSFVNVFERDSYKRYSCDLLIVPGSEADKLIGATINEVARAGWGDNAKAKLEHFIEQDEVAYRSGNKKKDQDGNVRTGYADMKVLTATSTVQPTLKDELANTINDAGKSSGKLYGGAYGTAIVEIWPQTGPKYYGIRCQLQGLQHYKDGESFGGGRRARDDEFEPVPGNVDKDDLVGAGNPDLDDDIPF